ncbi:MAG: CDGSH iron-sulfur domain-containing protein [Acidimicrobiales bacterium]
MPDEAKVTSRAGGPLMVTGGLPVVRKRPVHSEHGEPMTWQTSEPLTDRDTYALCRCGQSGNKPFCDGAHKEAEFEGVDTADQSTYADRARELGGSGLTVTDDRSICVHAGFCGTRHTNIWKQVADTADSAVRIAVINEVEKCPSGALTYRFDGDDADTEPDLPAQVGVIDDGPLWVCGGAPVTTAAGVELEPRNRVTLCRCGQSDNKPLCDGSHKEAGFTDS